MPRRNSVSTSTRDQEARWLRPSHKIVFAMIARAVNEIRDWRVLRGDRDSTIGYNQSYPSMNLVVVLLIPLSVFW